MTGSELGVLRDTVLPTYARADITVVRGEGCRIWDDEGREYLDFVAGIAVVGLGHCAPAPLAAAREQLDLLWHASNLYWTEPMLRLAALLAERFPGGRAFFCNSGAEANEAALKIARKATGRTRIVALEGGFHGRTLGALSATGQPSKWEGFGPLVPGISFARPNDVESLEAALAPAGDTALLLLEPVLGEGGVIPLEPAFAQAAAELALEVGALLCVDEVQAGMGRTGTFFAHEQLGITPDLITLAKGLGNGLPIGALLAGERAAPGFIPGDHGSTFGGNPVAAAAAAAVVEAIDDDLLAAVRARGAKLVTGPRGAPGRAYGARARPLDRGGARSARRSGRRCLPWRGSSRPLGRPRRAAADAAARRQRRRRRPSAHDPGRSAVVVNRRERQNAILRLVRDRALSTQAELVQALRDEGHEVVQTTVSRDVTELGLVKVRAPSGRLIYAAPGTGDADRLRAIGAAMRRYATGVEAANSGLVVVTTPSGYASALAQAIDEGAHPSIAGTLAGDNTIFIAAKDGTTARELQAELASYLADGVTPMTLWSGRVGGSLDPSVWAFLHADDAELLPYDCEASLQHARRLHGAGLLSDDELAEVEERLAGIALDPAGYLAEDEDVHSAIERQLGDVGRKIHAGRSRNDQVAAAFRLYVLDACAEARREIEALALVVLPSPRRRRTRCSPATPTSSGASRSPSATICSPGPRCSIATARASRLPRRRRPRARSAPVPSPARRSACLARRIRCATRSTPSPTATSRSTTSTPSTVLYTHLSRIGEEIVLWSTGEFGFVQLPESAATGSSMMPQKLNPDVAELARGKAGTAIGRLTGLLATVKGLPLAYDRDLQEDKAPVFAARADTRLGLRALAALVAGPRGRSRAHGRCRVGSARARDRRRGGAREGRRGVPRRSRAGGGERPRRIVHARRHARGQCRRTRRTGAGRSA